MMPRIDTTLSKKAGLGPIWEWNKGKMWQLCSRSLNAAFADTFLSLPNVRSDFYFTVVLSNCPSK